MQSQDLLREKQTYRTNLLVSTFVVLPLLVFAASSAYSVLALWRAKSLQALAAPEIQRLPFGMWVGNDITWAMKLAILSAGYFSLLLAYTARKQLWQNKAKLGILALLGAVQTLLCLDYIAKLQWFADDGVTAKGLVIIGFTAINAFLLIMMRGYIKERMVLFLTMPILSASVSRISESCSFLFWGYPSLLWQRHRQTLMFLGGSFLFVLLMYGGKVFFISYLTDDYIRFFLPKGTDMLISAHGRWAAQLLNNHIFFGPLHILPYFNTLWYLFVLLLSAYLTARIWKIENRKIQFGIICLTSITPYIAHNLSFNTNVTVPLGIFLAVFSVYLLVKNIYLAPISILITAFSTGIYQPVIQISLLILIIWLFQRFSKETSFKDFLTRFFLMGIVIFLGYLLSNAISDAMIIWKKLPSALGSNYSNARAMNLMDILQNAIQLLQNKPLPNLYLAYYSLQLKVLLYFLFGLVTIYISQFGPLKFILFILMVFPIQIILDLPLLFGVGPATRAYIHIGWLIAGLFTLLQQSKWHIFTVFSRLVCILIFLFSSIYISQFYDSISRQTENDIRQANQIVNRIRLMPEYQKEPMPFLIVGEKKFSVTGQTIPFQVALNTSWSKYSIFRHFTDFSFRNLNAQEEEQIRNKLATRQDLANYPDKGSILFIDGTALLILDNSQISLNEENAKAIIWEWN